MERLPLMRLFSLFLQIECKMHETFYHEAHEGHEVINLYYSQILPHLFFVSFMRSMVNFLFRLRWT